MPHTNGAGYLKKRWSPLRYHPVQHALWNSKARFKTVPAGRRSGKTELFKRKLVISALIGTSFPEARFFAAAPTRDQAKRIYWNDLKSLVPGRMLAGPPRESDLAIRLLNGSEIWVVGLDKPERIEGTPWDGGGVDEIANVKKTAWPENIRPALSDRFGWCWLIGVPEGRNHYYNLDRYARGDSSGEWASFHWKSADILPPEEIESARRELDPLSFQQEYEADFLNFTGRIYYPYNASIHAKPGLAKLYNPRQPLIICFDFNVSPGVAAVCQEMELPNGVIGTGVIGEVYIPRNSNTVAVCRKLILDWKKHPGYFELFGDATGGAQGSAKVLGSDWDLIKQEFFREFGPERVRVYVPRSNPAERSRVNAVNSRLLNGAGVVHMMVDPQKAPHVALDFEGVKALEGGSGEIDKASDPDLTHISDALGYYVAMRYPIVPGVLQSREAH